MEPQITPQNQPSADGQQGQDVHTQSSGMPQPGLSQPDIPIDNQASAPVQPAGVINSLPVSSPRRQKRGVLFGLIIAAVLLLLSGGAAASYYYVVNQPENVLKQALANTMNLEKSRTLHFSGSVSAGQDSGLTAGATYKGALDNASGAFDVSGALDLAVTNVSFDFRSTDAKTFYVKVGGLKGLSQLLAGSTSQATTYAPFMNALDDQWIEINSSLIKTFNKSYKSTALTEADAKKMADAYGQHPFLTVSDVLPEEKVGGENSFHYKVSVDGAKLKSFFAALKDAKLDNLAISQDMLTQLNKTIDQADFGKYPFEIWISKGDKMIKQLAFTAAPKGTSLTFRLTFDSYNEAVKVEKPKDAKSLLELMSGSLGGGLTLPALQQGSGISL